MQRTKQNQLQEKKKAITKKRRSRKLARLDRDVAIMTGMISGLPRNNKDLDTLASAMVEKLHITEHGPSSFDEVWTTADPQFKSINAATVREIAQHFFVLGQIHAPLPPLENNTHELHEFKPGFDEICTICDKTELDGNHASADELDYSDVANPQDLIEPKHDE